MRLDIHDLNHHDEQHMQIMAEIDKSKKKNNEDEMYSIILTDGKIININATQVKWHEESRTIELCYGTTSVARINMDNIVGYIDAKFR